MRRWRLYQEKLCWNSFHQPPDGASETAASHLCCSLSVSVRTSFPFLLILKLHCWCEKGFKINPQIYKAGCFVEFSEAIKKVAGWVTKGFQCLIEMGLDLRKIWQTDGETGRRGRVRRRALWALHRLLLLPVGSSWPINILKGGLKPAWLNFLLTLILSSSRSRAAPNPSCAHASQLLGWCCSYWTDWCK